jgi:hypothetical protein
MQHKACASACALLLFLSAGEAAAESMAGSLGFGGTTSLAGATGITGTYYPSDRLGLQAVFAFSTYSPDGGSSVTGLEVGASVLFILKSLEKVNLSAVGNMALGYVDAGMSGTEFAFGGGLRGEYFPTPNFSLFLETGLVLRLIPETGATLDPADVDGLATMEGTLFNLSADVAGSAGFTVWFK